MTGFLPLAVSHTGMILLGDRASALRHKAATGQMLVWLLIAIGLITAVALAVFFGNQFVYRRRHNSHPGLFAALCRVHGLDGNTRRLLRQVARSHNLAQPARLLTEPQWLDPVNLRGSVQRRRAELTKLRNRLFAEVGR